MRFKISKWNWGILVNTKLFGHWKFKIRRGYVSFNRWRYWYINFKGGQIYIRDFLFAIKVYLTITLPGNYWEWRQCKRKHWLYIFDGRSFKRNADEIECYCTTCVIKKLGIKI